jgi:hypothetical protein
MKKLYFSFAIVLLTFGANAQDNPYFELFVSSSTYAPLENSNSLNQGVVWDDPDWSLPIGFEFEYLGYNFDSLVFYGYDGYGAELLFKNITGGSPDCQISAYMMDLIDSEYDNNGKAASDVRYTLEGTTGSQIFKLEWSNVAFYNDDIEETNYSMRMNFQIWLFEQDNAIEFHYGPSQNLDNNVIQDYAGIPVTFIRNYIEVPDYAWEGAYMLSGDPSAPTWIYAATPGDFDNASYLTDTPVDGTVYRFIPTLVGVTEHNVSKEINIYPNPASDKINIPWTSEEKEVVQIFDALGRTVFTAQLNSGMNSIDVSAWESGVYTLHIQQGDSLFVEKLMVQ